MIDEFVLHYDKETGFWEEHKEPYLTLEIGTKEDYEWLMEAVREKQEREQRKEAHK